MKFAHYFCFTISKISTLAVMDALEKLDVDFFIVDVFPEGLTSFACRNNGPKTVPQLYIMARLDGEITSRSTLQEVNEKNPSFTFWHDVITS